MFFSVKLKYFFVSFLCGFYKKTINFCSKFFNKFNSVQKNKIVFCSSQGRSVGCNPKYIAKEILRQNLPYELVWLAYPEFSKNISDLKGVRFVDYSNISLKMKELSKAKIWIDSSYKIEDLRLGLTKKKNQFYINTWHGSLGIKKMFYDSQTSILTDSFMHWFDKDFKNCDLMIANCDWEKEIYKSALGFKNEIQILGHARNDIFFEDSKKYKKMVLDELGLDSNINIALYMPSFRDSLDIECYDLNYDILKNTLEEKFGGKWVVATRFHSTNVKKDKKILEQKASLYDLTYYSDMQELLAGVDVLISDYSSCMFDYILTNRPCFIYASDIEQYNTTRGFYYPLEKTPFLISKTNDELRENILKFDIVQYQADCKKFLQEKNVVDDGNASKRIVELIKKIID